MGNQKIAHIGLFFVLFLSGISILFAQTLNKPIPADNPNLAGNSPWTAACAKSTFNEFFVEFTWSPPLVDAANEFILELSDANGDFSSPTELDKISDKNTSFTFNFDFILPVTTQGENYKFRVRSTNPAKTSPESDAFNLYYMDFTSSMLISEDASGTIPTGGTLEICNGGSLDLGIHNVPNADIYTYTWTRSGTVLPDTTPNITVTQAGTYLVEINYGPICSSSANTLSNAIIVNTGTLLGVALNPPAKTAICSGETLQIEANISGQGLSYIWKKDGTTVSGPTIDQHLYIVDGNTVGFEGDYTVEISGTGVCRETSAPITITNAGNFSVTLSNPTNLVILPGNTVSLGVTTSASTPTYQWYRNNVIITGATNSSFNATIDGSYFVRIGQSGGACTSTTKDSDIINVVQPASFDITMSHDAAYTSCISSNATLTVTKIDAVATDGSKTDVTSELIGNFSYQWKREAANITGATNNNLTISNPSENGNYTVVGVIDSFTATSNTLDTKLGTGSILTISSTDTTLCDGGNPIILSTTTDLSGKTFEWQRNGTAIDNSSTTITATLIGTYTLHISDNGCNIDSNEIIISNFNEDLVTLSSGPEAILIEGSTEDVTASGADSYVWYNQAAEVISNNATVSLSLEGTYSVVASIGSCMVTKEVLVTYRDTFAVPNVITPNADGVNDQWQLPNTYSNQEDITVIIYNAQGEEIVNETDYKNNWPSASVSFAKQNMVFYYKIRSTTETLKQGTITIIR